MTLTIVMMELHGGTRRASLVMRVVYILVVLVNLVDSHCGRRDIENVREAMKKHRGVGCRLVKMDKGKTIFIRIT